MSELVASETTFYNDHVAAIHPQDNYLSLGGDEKLQYDHLVIAPGIKVDYNSVKGLREAM